MVAEIKTVGIPEGEELLKVTSGAFSLLALFLDLGLVTPHVQSLKTHQAENT